MFCGSTSQTAFDMTTSAAMLDLAAIRAAYPILHQEVYGKPLTYFDNAASSQKPLAVIERIKEYYEHEHSNVHRGVHFLSQTATDEFERVRFKVQAFLNAPDANECIYVRGTTEGINLVAWSFGERFVQQGDEIIISEMEHHANIVPWQMMCERRGAHLRVIPIHDNGTLNMDVYAALLNEKTRLVAVTHTSNVLGTVNPVQQMAEMAHAAGAYILVDGAQSAPHQAVDVQELGCDFFVFSAHKLYGPTGIGVLWGKSELLNEMPPYMTGGNMIRVVTFDKTTFNDLPHKFETGTPNIADTIGLGAALDYIETIGIEAIGAHEHALLGYATQLLEAEKDIRFFGTAPSKAGVISFLIGDIHPYDAGTIFDRQGIALRTGHHCCQPLMQRYQIPGTMRISFAVYNTIEEVDRIPAAIAKARKMFS